MSSSHANKKPRFGGRGGGGRKKLKDNHLMQISSNQTIASHCWPVTRCIDSNFATALVKSGFKGKQLHRPQRRSRFAGFKGKLPIQKRGELRHVTNFGLISTIPLGPFIPTMGSNHPTKTGRITPKPKSRGPRPSKGHMRFLVVASSLQFINSKKVTHHPGPWWSF